MLNSCTLKFEFFMISNNEGGRPDIPDICSDPYCMIKFSDPLRNMSHLCRKPAHSFIFGFFLIKLSASENSTVDTAWSYGDQESWNGQCRGAQQSPIDIPRRG